MRTAGQQQHGKCCILQVATTGPIGRQRRSTVMFTRHCGHLRLCSSDCSRQWVWKTLQGTEGGAGGTVRIAQGHAHVAAAATFLLPRACCPFTYWPHSRSAHHSSVDVSEDRQMTHCTPGMAAACRYRCDGGSSRAGATVGAAARLAAAANSSLRPAVAVVLRAQLERPCSRPRRQCRRRKQPGAAGPLLILIQPC